MTDKDDSRFLVGFVIGATIGVVAGLLYAPRSGEETRILIREKVDIAREKATDLAHRIQSTAEDVQQQIQKLG